MLATFWILALAAAVLAALGCALQVARDTLARLPRSNRDWIFY